MTTNPDCGPPTPPTPATPPTPHTLRFRYLAGLCFTLGRYRCTSMLIHPRTGETVLWVPYACRPKTRPGVGAVQSSGGRWLFSWGGREWNAADDIEGTVARIAQIVTGW